MSCLCSNVTFSHLNTYVFYRFPWLKSYPPLDMFTPYNKYVCMYICSMCVHGVWRYEWLIYDNWCSGHRVSWAQCTQSSRKVKETITILSTPQFATGEYEAELQGYIGDVAFVFPLIMQWIYATNTKFMH